MARNLCADPAANTAAWAVVASAGGANNGTTVSGTTLTRSTARRAVNGGTAAAQGVYGPALPVTPGQAVSATVEAAASASIGLTYLIIWYDSAGNGLSSTTGPTIAAGSVTANTAYARAVAGTAPASAATCRVGVQTSTAAAANAVLYGTACRYIYGTDSSLVFFDGATAGCLWDGTANASTSTSRDHTAAATLLLSSPLFGVPRPRETGETFTGKANRTVHGSRDDVGRTWISVASANANPHSGMEVRGGALDTPTGYVLGSGLYYAQQDFGAGNLVGEVGCKLVWRNSSSTDGRACLGAFNIVADQFTSSNGAASMHLTVLPTIVVMATVTAGLDSYTNISPVSGGAPEQTLAVPMAADGVTEYRIDLRLDRARSLVYVTVQNNPTLVYSHSSFGTVAGRYAFWENGAISSSGTNWPRFTDTWAYAVA